MLQYLRSGDVVVVSRLDRLARSTADLLALAHRIDQAGAGLRSLTEPWADTTTPDGAKVMLVLTGVAQFERALDEERTRRARSVALERGVKFGRPPKHSPERIQIVMEYLESGMLISEVAKRLEVHPATVYRWRATYRELRDSHRNAQPVVDGEQAATD